MKIETKEFTKKARDYDIYYDGSVHPYYYDRLIFQLFRYYYEPESDCFAPRIGLGLFQTYIFGSYRSFLGFNLSGFRRNNKPNCLRANLTITIFYRKFRFNLGLADKGWNYIRWVEGYSFLRKLHFKLIAKKGDLPF